MSLFCGRPPVRICPEVPEPLCRSAGSSHVRYAAALRLQPPEARTGAARYAFRPCVIRPLRHIPRSRRGARRAGFRVRGPGRDRRVHSPLSRAAEIRGLPGRANFVFQFQTQNPRSGNRPGRLGLPAVLPGCGSGDRPCAQGSRCSARRCWSPAFRGRAWDIFGHSLRSAGRHRPAPGPEAGLPDHLRWWRDRVSRRSARRWRGSGPGPGGGRGCGWILACAGFSLPVSNASPRPQYSAVVTGWE